MRTITVIALALLFTGCSSSGPLKPGASYPSILIRTEPSTIQLVRETRHVEMTNVTARSFGESRIWLNQWYSAEIDGFAVGETIRLPLTRFTDEFGDSFRGGGFFAAEAPDRLVKAELETDAARTAGTLGGERVLVPLIVVGDQE
ncbi:MAG: hypothetical protein AAF235_10960 [Planctomycetota bacterium]